MSLLDYLTNTIRRRSGSRRDTGKSQSQSQRVQRWAADTSRFVPPAPPSSYVDANVPEEVYGASGSGRSRAGSRYLQPQQVPAWPMGYDASVRDPYAGMEGKTVSPTVIYDRYYPKSSGSFQHNGTESGHYPPPSTHHSRSRNGAARSSYGRPESVQSPGTAYHRSHYSHGPGRSSSGSSSTASPRSSRSSQSRSSRSGATYISEPTYTTALPFRSGKYIIVPPPGQTLDVYLPPRY